MIKIKFYGVARLKFNVKEFEMEPCKDIKHLLDGLADKFSVPAKHFHSYLIYINDVNIHELGIYKAKLHDGDVIMFFSPSTGG